jgi:hypothetical protein
MRSIGSALALLALAVGLVGLGYARWTREVERADAALARGDVEAALLAYAAAERRFDGLPAARQLFRPDYERVVANQLWALYAAQRFDEVIDKASQAPEGAAPHFWTGCALFASAGREEDAEARLAWLTRAEEEFRRALAGAPDDWDTKVNFELTARVLSELRKQPKAPPPQVLQLLRPPPVSVRPARRVG